MSAYTWIHEEIDAAVETVLRRNFDLYSDRAEFYTAEAVQAARIVIEAVGPMIEAAALERAAKVAEGAGLSPPWAEHVANVIRALKEQP